LKWSGVKSPQTHKEFRTQQAFTVNPARELYAARGSSLVSPGGAWLAGSDKTGANDGAIPECGHARLLKSWGNLQ